MGKYRLIERLGEGGFGSVWKAINKWTEEVVAVKRLHKKKNDRWYESLFKEEQKCLRALQHPNIVELRDTYVEGGHLHMVLEYMDSDLWSVIKKKKEPSLDRTVQRLCYKVLKALQHIHALGYCHRDLKPENLLVKGSNIKISDFGFAINMREKKEKGEPLYPNVVTIAYRAPELLLKSSSYDFAIDMWSFGVIIAHLYSRYPIFRSSTDWRKQIYNICSVIGCPNDEMWPEGLKLADSLNYQFPQEFNGVNCANNLRRLMPTASNEVIDLVKRLCSWDPKRRPTVEEALRHPFFQLCNRSTVSTKFLGYDRNGKIRRSFAYNGLEVSKKERQQGSKPQRGSGIISREKGLASISKEVSRPPWR